MGELVPKALTLDRSETLAVLVARPIALIAAAFRPVVSVLQGSAQVLLRPFGVHDVVAGGTIRSPAELRGVIDEAEGSGVIPLAQEELLHNVFDFAWREAGDVMLPASEVAWLDAALTADQAVEQVLRNPHTRYPVGDGVLDRLVGVIHAGEVVAGRTRRSPRADRAARPASHGRSGDQGPGPAAA